MTRERTSESIKLKTSSDASKIHKLTGKRKSMVSFQ